MSTNYKRAVGSVTGLQAGFTDSWKVLDGSAWRSLTVAELSAVEIEATRIDVLDDEASAKEARVIALASLTVQTAAGNVFDGNETARNNMLSAIQSAAFLGQTEATWKLADNSPKLVTLDELKEALALSISRVGEIVIS